MAVKLINLVGTFVLRNEGDGCLTSKYFHSGQSQPHVEACKRKVKSKFKVDGFDGEYKTVWIQDLEYPDDALLKIVWHQTGNTYQLFWTGSKGPIFEGIGMVYDGLLVGAYWNL